MNRAEATTAFGDPGSGGATINIVCQYVIIWSVRDESAVGWVGNSRERSRVKGEVSVVNRVLRVDITEEVTSEQSLEGGEGVNHVDIWGRVFWKGNSQCKGPTAQRRVWVWLWKAVGRGRGQIRKSLVSSFMNCLHWVKWESWEGVEQRDRSRVL